MATTYLKDISNKTDQGINAIDTRYNAEPNTVDVTSYYNPQGIHFKTNEGMQYGLAYDPQAQLHYIADPNLFYKALNMPNNIYNVGQNTNTTTIQPPSTIPVGNEPKPSQVGVFTNKALNILENNKPPENIVDPNAVKEAMGKTQTYMSNPSTIPYDKMTSNADYINQQYDAQKTSLIEELKAGIQKSRDDYNFKASQLPLKYDPLRTQASNLALQDELKIREAMAKTGMAQTQGGIGGSGLNMTLQQMARTGSEQAIAGYNQQEQQALNEINMQLASLMREESAGTNKISSQVNLERLKSLLDDKRAIEEGNYTRQQNSLTNQLKLSDILSNQYNTQTNQQQNAISDQIRGYTELGKMSQSDQQLAQSAFEFANKYNLDVNRFSEETLNNKRDYDIKLAGLTGYYNNMPTMDRERLASDLALATANVTGMNLKNQLTQKDLDNYDALFAIEKSGKELTNKQLELKNNYQTMINDQAPDQLKAELEAIKQNTQSLKDKGELDKAKAYQDMKFEQLRLNIQKAYNDGQLSVDAAKINLGYAEIQGAKDRAEIAKDSAYEIAKLDNKNDINEVQKAVDYGMQMKLKSVVSDTENGGATFTNQYNDNDLLKWASQLFAGDDPKLRDRKQAYVISMLGLDKNKIFKNMGQIMGPEEFVNSIMNPILNPK